jgi:hypothetical protein
MDVELVDLAGVEASSTGGSELILVRRAIDCWDVLRLAEVCE